jgi:hypothetical protein
MSRLTFRYIARNTTFYSKRYDARRIEITWFLRRSREALSDVHSGSMVRMRWIRKPASACACARAYVCVWVVSFSFPGFPFPFLHSGAYRGLNARAIQHLFISLTGTSRVRERIIIRGMNNSYRISMSAKKRELICISSISGNLREISRACAELLSKGWSLCSWCFQRDIFWLLNDFIHTRFPLL